MTWDDIKYLCSWEFLKWYIKWGRLRDIVFCVLGTFIYCLGVNLFVVPMNLYSGGFVGFAQILLYLIPIKFAFNVQGIIYFLLNIPLFIIGYKILGKRFIFVSILIIIEESILLSVIPVLDKPLIDDVLTGCIIGGGIQGFGCGLTFLGFGSGGGTDLMGMIVSKKYKSLSVGNVSLFVNAFLYLICAYLFNFEVAIYSTILSVVTSLVIDKVHLQNSNVEINILSDKAQVISDMIIKELNRSTTILSGIGGFTGEKKDMIVSIMSEYELNKCKREIYDIDEGAFIFIKNSISVLGNFEKRLN